MLKIDILTSYIQHNQYFSLALKQIIISSVEVLIWKLAMFKDNIDGNVFVNTRISLNLVKCFCWERHVGMD